MYALRALAPSGCCVSARRPASCSDISACISASLGIGRGVSAEEGGCEKVLCMINGGCFVSDVERFVLKKGEWRDEERKEG